MSMSEHVKIYNSLNRTKVSDQSKFNRIGRVESLNILALWAILICVDICAAAMAVSPTAHM